MAAKNKAKTEVKEKITSTLAKGEDGSIQITFQFPFDLIKKTKEKVIADLSKEVAVPGFRKGNAPKEKVEQHLSQNTVVEKTLNQLLPKALSEAITEHKIKPATHPKVELISAEENKPWQVRAITCELPEIELGEYKKVIAGEARSEAIWTPGKEGKEKKEPDRAEKEQQIIKTLIKTVKIDIPQVLINDEVNARLSRLLEKIEKLGLSLEKYLSSIGKTPELLRKEYGDQAREAIILDLSLSKIAQKENIQVKDEEIEAAVKASAADPNLAEEVKSPEQKQLIKNILMRRKVVDSLVSLLPTAS